MIRSVTRRYDAVLFDAGETLVHPSPSFGGLLHQLIADLGHRFDPDDVERHARAALTEASAEALGEGRTWSTSNEASRDFWTGIYRSLFATLGVDDDHGRLADTIYGEFTKPHHYVLFPDAMPALRELKALGYRLGVISNWEDWLAGLLEALGVTPLLDVVVVSGAEGVEKPDPQIFHLALQQMEIPPARAVYVGDSPSHDVRPALALGMGAVLLDRHGYHNGVHRPTIGSLGLLTAALT